MTNCPCDYHLGKTIDKLDYTERACMRKDMKNAIDRVFLFGMGVSLGAVALAYSLCVSSVIPKVNNVQEGFVPPSKIEVILKDTDGDGKKETYLKIDGREIPVKYDLKKQ